MRSPCSDVRQQVADKANVCHKCTRKRMIPSLDERGYTYLNGLQASRRVVYALPGTGVFRRAAVRWLWAFVRTIGGGVWSAGAAPVATTQRWRLPGRRLEREKRTGGGLSRRTLVCVCLCVCVRLVQWPRMRVRACARANVICCSRRRAVVAPYNIIIVARGTRGT